MFEQNDFDQLAEMVSKAVIFQLDTSMLQLENKICDRITGVETRLEEKITKVETKFDERMANLEIKYDNLDKKVTELREKVERLDEKVTELDGKVKKMDKKVSMIQSTVDNQMNKNIRIIAEGHLSLNEKLDKVIQIMHKQEIMGMGLQMTSLENKIQMILVQLGYSC